MRSPGEPLNSLQLPANQGIGFIWCPNYYGVANPNYPQGVRLPNSFVMVEKANYVSRDIPMQYLRSDYKS